MYADFRVEIPNEVGKITRKTIKGTTYIYYQTDRIYHSDKKYSQPKATTIGKMCEDDSSMMIPNDKYMIFFPEAALPEAKAASSRSACLRVGTYMVIRKIIAEYGLDTMLKEVLGGEEDLFLDLATYSIIAENNAGQYYPDYAYNHPLFTEDMKIYRDSKVSSFINGIKKEQSVEFLNRWNESVTHKNRIYISYDSTNKNCQAGDIDLAEFGQAKGDKSKPIINYSVGYDRTKRIPLWYEAYPGSIVDISQLHATLQKVDGLGYKRIGFILDRGYFSKENIHEMDRMGYDIIIMMKGKKALVSDLVMEVKGIFEEDRRCSIRDYKVSGTTVKRQLYPSDEKERYFHIYYNESKRITEREHLEAKIDQLGELLQEKQGTIGYECPRAICECFDPVYHTKRDVKTFVSARERTDVINREIALCGYFVIITSEKMTAEEALEEYKSWDASEKLFRGDKSYLGNRSYRVHSTESVENKIFIEFVALIIRSKIYTSLKDQMRMKKKDNYMTVPAAIKELEKIEMIRLSDGNYRLEHAVTSTQKEILKAFNLTGRNVQEQAIGINEELRMIRERK